jgi:hypothetical protein
MAYVSLMSAAWDAVGANTKTASATTRNRVTGEKDFSLMIFLLWQKVKNVDRPAMVSDSATGALHRFERAVYSR